MCHQGKGWVPTDRGTGVSQGEGRCWGGGMVWLWGVCWVPRDRGPGVSWDEGWVPRAIDWEAWGSLGYEGQVPRAED